jgi:hypothetical protein
MSPKFAHSSEGVYLFPISHSNRFHNLLYYNINLYDVLDLVVTVNELVVTVPDSVMKLVIVDTVIDSCVTVLDLLVKEQ